MPPPVTTNPESGSHQPYSKAAGSEPLPGYRLMEPLGRGGFGEVWKCEAPGGLHKAVKFVSGGESEDGQGERRFAQELEAFQQIKAIRHPFLLTLERVEIVGGELIMVMELADRQLQDRFRECRTCGLPGIPRDELLAYFADAAEALDMISAKYGLQHLDVKPANLFLVAGHVKVGDYGLVAQLNPDGPTAGNRGLTPKYVAPEALRGEPSNRSDQYSLALVYQELLTGTFPYNGKTAQQIMLQHVSSKPDLSGLPPGDQPIVLQALAKDPEQRFSSCLAFVQALLGVSSATALPNSGMDVRRARVQRSMSEMNLPAGDAVADEVDTGGRHPVESTQNFTLPGGAANITRPGAAGRLPALVSTNRRPGSVVQAPSGAQQSAARVAPQQPQPTAPPPSRFAVVLNPIKSVVPVARLIGMPAHDSSLTPPDFAMAVLGEAAAGGHIPQMAGDLGRQADGTWICRFPSTVPLPVVPIKLAIVRDTFRVNAEQPEPTQIVFRQMVTSGFFSSRAAKNSGFEVTVHLPPPGKVVGEIVVTGTLFGVPDKDFSRQAQDVIPQMIASIRRELKNVDDRRKHPRIPAQFPITLYPIHGDGGIDNPVYARCRDVSLVGLSVATETTFNTKYAYAAFEGVGITAGQTILVRWVRTQVVDRMCISGGYYRTDL
ncbi:serine threonine protein kinase : Probable serine/threonine protein kinase OS=Blastopirellula marina DSM 3645 GN=DSM3645_24085 PE=4 SV=1: Pkinase [Gemmataceae bacterium]|nr:serine threonine protein kinase : Probable serine/threonine protein kinase OS=Blastopirellula marina DSM 3645 GN=DSM3645_24085 PE=4 SV=1: Pkinase [Gemmataceae bacterium]VTU00750.1 serine threonine protein kinase : Probable serine/threonine protein kinase OS=Blastopirellula marina DSM 3645 GN=DSM3645_24085 PE=4 SV=1: Pkinase [Gemmataceae bacterium]